MSMIDLFSNRADIANGYVPDVYQYDYLPEQLRVQIVYILRDAIGPFEQFRISGTIQNNETWKRIHDSVAKEHGTFDLSAGSSPKEKCENFVLDKKISLKKMLDDMEFSHPALK